MVNNRRETTSRVITGRMTVRDGRRFAANVKGLLFIFGDQADRRHTHHAAAALAVVQRRLQPPPLFAAQRRQTCIARSAAAVQTIHSDQPAVHLVFRELRPTLLTLRAQPSDISLVNRRGRMASALVTPPRDGAQQPFGREERHLRVVGDCPTPAVSGVVVCDSGRSILGVNPMDAVELDRRAQRITYSAPQQTAREMSRRSPASRLITVGQRRYKCFAHIGYSSVRSWIVSRPCRSQIPFVSRLG